MLPGLKQGKLKGHQQHVCMFDRYICRINDDMGNGMWVMLSASEISWIKNKSSGHLSENGIQQGKGTTFYGGM